MIEAIVISHLAAETSLPVYAERPEVPDSKYIIVEKTGSDRRNHIDIATLAIQSHAPTLYDAAALNLDVKAAMDKLIANNTIAKVALNSDYNYTDETTKTYRYQAVYDITYYEEG